METGNRIQEFKERAKAYYSSKTPVHIITLKDSWINGFIAEEPGEFFFKVLDREDGIIKVHYVDVDTFDEYTGPYSALKEVEK